MNLRTTKTQIWRGAAPTGLMEGAHHRTTRWSKPGRAHRAAGFGFMVLANQPGVTAAVPEKEVRGGLENISVKTRK